MNVLILIVKINKNSVKYLQGINFSQLTLTSKTEIKNLGHTTPELVIFQSSLSRKQMYVRKLYTLIYTQHEWLSGCADRNGLLSPSD
jgi:hypothetical protein